MGGWSTQPDQYRGPIYKEKDSDTGGTGKTLFSLNNVEAHVKVPLQGFKRAVPSIGALSTRRKGTAFSKSLRGPGRVTLWASTSTWDLVGKPVSSRESIGARGTVVAALG